jgi:signal transduction histidine kinase
VNHSNTGQRPHFFWQGVMIILPVLALAVAGLVSLRQDEQTAEQTAWQRAAQNVQSLTRAMRVIANDELRRYETLQNEWLTGLRAAARPSGSVTFPDGKLMAAINQWEQTYPGLKLTKMAVPTGGILGDGREIYPPEIPAVPSPPKWFSDLSPSQKALWQALRLAGDDGARASAAAEAFLATKPAEDACQAADYLRQSPQEILRADRLLPAESGISFQDVASYRLCSADEPVSPPLWDKVWRQIFESPSFVAPTLLTLAEEKAGRADPRLQDKVRWMRQLWESESPARQWLDALRRLPEFHDWMLFPPQQTPWARWCDASSERALAVVSQSTFTNAGVSAVSTSGNGYQVSFVPRSVVKSIFERALAENRFFVPDYATVGLELEGEPLVLPGLDFVHRDDPPMATAGSWGKGDDQTLQFTTAFYLLSREKMLSMEQRRARLFSALIGAVVLVATAGLIAARRAFYQQQRLGEMKSNFVSSVSHELRAPIASMRLLSEALERGKISDPAKQQEYYRFLVQESRRLTSLIENVLDFSRIEQGRKEYRFEPADLDALASQTVKLMLPYAGEHQVQLLWQPGREPAPQLSCDGPALQQALINLIDNAVKHSPAGAAVSIGLESAAGSVRLWVEDRGAGIPPEDHEKIFERFYRRGSELRRETQGIGIGLTIVKHIVEAHGGRVLVRSGAGRGSRFTLELPLKQE